MKFVIIFISLFFSKILFAADITIQMLNKLEKRNMVFSEEIVKINVGDTVFWEATDKGHNVEFKAGPEGWDIPKKSKNNKEVAITFDMPGVYFYQCTPHATMGMIALVVVGDDTSNKNSVMKQAKARGKSKNKLKELLENL